MHVYENLDQTLTYAKKVPDPSKEWGTPVNSPGSADSSKRIDQSGGQTRLRGQLWVRLLRSKVIYLPFE